MRHIVLAKSDASFDAQKLFFNSSAGTKAFRICMTTFNMVRLILEGAGGQTDDTRSTFRQLYCLQLCAFSPTCFLIMCFLRLLDYLTFNVEECSHC